MDHFHDTSIPIQPNQLDPTFESHSHSDFIKTYIETWCDVLLESSQEYVNPDLPNMNLKWDATDSCVSFSWTQDQEPMEPINESISNPFELECLNSTPWVESDCDHTYTPEVETISIEEETNDSTKLLIHEQDLVITPLPNYTPLPRYDMIFRSYLDCHIPWSYPQHHPSITIKSFLDQNFGEIVTIPPISQFDKSFYKNIPLIDPPPHTQVVSPFEEDALRTLGDLAGINIDNLPPLTTKQNDMMDDLILDLNYDSHLSFQTSCHDLPFEDPYYLNSTKDHDSYANNFILPPSWVQYERMDQGGFCQDTIGLVSLMIVTHITPIQWFIIKA